MKTKGCTPIKPVVINMCKSACELEGTFWDDNDMNPAAHGYVLPIMLNYECGDLHVRERRVLVRLKRVQSASFNAFTAAVYDAFLDRNEESKRRLEHVLRWFLPREVGFMMQYARVPRDNATTDCGIHTILHGICLMHCGQPQSLVLSEYVGRSSTQWQPTDSIFNLLRELGDGIKARYGGDKPRTYQTSSATKNDDAATVAGKSGRRYWALGYAQQNKSERILSYSKAKN
ncbi:hypothetical protein G7054_g5709 [Neopestalotiopsis clavispora]|nr:hypothetical protein G7054_g5709 [Neopestalotiopsis clavispora]